MVVWFITNCATYFSREIAFRALRFGHTVIAASYGHESEEIADLKDKGALPIMLLSSYTDEEIRKSVEAVVEHCETVDILVHGPGAMKIGMFEEVSPEELRDVFNANFFLQVVITQAIAPYMRRQESGTIAFMGGIEGWVGAEALSTHVASFWAIAGFAQSVRPELNHFNIQVTVIEPGFYPRPLFLPQDASDSEGSIEDYEKKMERIREGAKECMAKSDGDVSSAVVIIVQALLAEGLFKEKRLPPRLVLGVKPVAFAEVAMGEQKRWLEEWKDLSCSAPFQRQMEKS